MNNNIILSVKNISKQYQLGVFGSGTIGGDVQHWWYKIHKKEDIKLLEVQLSPLKGDALSIGLRNKK